MVYKMTLNGWLTLVICRDKNLKSCNLENQAFLANTQQQCFACCSKKIHQMSIILGHCIECLSPLTLSPRKLEILKAQRNRNVPIYLFHASVNIENCLGLRKKLLGLGPIISVRISRAEVFFSIGAMEENRWQHCAFTQKSQRMEVADKQHTSSKTMPVFRANFTSQSNILNTYFINSVV